MIFCPSPWHSILVDWNGDVSPDRHFGTKIGNIFDQTIPEMWGSDVMQRVRASMLNNTFPEQCHRCQSKEQAVGASRRTFFHDVLVPMLEPGLKYETNPIPDIRFVEINPTNVCNLKCRMCSGEDSTAWLKDEMALISQGLDFRFNSKLGYRKAPKGLLDRLFLHPECFRNLQYINIKGGEPFKDEECFALMEALIDIGVSHKVVLDLSTNGTDVDHRIFDIATKFKEVKLHISMEATGEMYQYMRGGEHFTIADLERNVAEFSKMENTRIIFATVLCAYNIFEIPRIWKWFNNIRKENHEIYFTNVVADPKYLAPAVMPLEARREALEEIIDANIPNRLHEPHGPIMGVNGIVNGLGKEILDDTERKLLFSRLYAFTIALDKLRGESLLSVEPRFKKYLVK